MKLLILIAASCLTIQLCHAHIVKKKITLTQVGDRILHFGVNSKLNFFKAAHYCRRQHMDLLSINTETEQKQLEEALTKNGHSTKTFWTSGNDLGEEGQFSWLKNGNWLNYTNWKNGEPTDSYNENCIAIVSDPSYTWNDLPCDEPHNFICEM